MTLMVPDAAVRVLLLDFDALPAKPAEALPVVRFRLKKLLPFDADDAAVSYQVMSASKDLLHVLAVAMPRELLADYELVVREAGFEPGACPVRWRRGRPARGRRAAAGGQCGARGGHHRYCEGGSPVLHRTVDLGADCAPIGGRPRPNSCGQSASGAAAAQLASNALPAGMEPAGFERQNDVAAAIGTTALAQEIEAEIAQEIAAESSLAKTADEVAQAVSVAAAYFEDTLETLPSAIHTAGTLGAEALAALLDAAQVGPLAVQEMLSRRCSAPAQPRLAHPAESRSAGWRESGGRWQTDAHLHQSRNPSLR